MKSWSTFSLKAMLLGISCLAIAFAIAPLIHRAWCVSMLKSYAKAGNF